MRSHSRCESESAHAPTCGSEFAVSLKFFALEEGAKNEGGGEKVERTSINKRDCTVFAEPPARAKVLLWRRTFNFGRAKVGPAELTSPSSPLPLCGGAPRRLKFTPFKDVFVEPAANAMGGSSTRGADGSTVAPTREIRRHNLCRRRGGDAALARSPLSSLPTSALIPIASYRWSAGDADEGQARALFASLKVRSRSRPGRISLVSEPQKVR